jgi:hypothetical protein
MAEWTGLEPATPGVTGRYSNQLNYHSGAYCWWVLRGSNPRPSPCKGDALPAELSTLGQSGLVYGVLESLASFEPRNVARGDADRLTRARIATAARGAMLYTERPKADNGDLLSLLQRARNAVHHRVHCTTRIRFGEVGCDRYRIDEFSFVHSNPLHECAY